MQKRIESNLLNPYRKTLDLYGIYGNDSIEKRVILGLSLSLLSRMNDINLLIENNSLDSVQVLMRSAFETQTYIIYLFKDLNKLNQRCNAYHYSSYQKFLYYLTHMQYLSLGSKEDLITRCVKTHSFSKNDKNNNLSWYLNHFRDNFRNSIPIKGNGKKNSLFYEYVSESNVLQKTYKIDQRKWYNDDDKEVSFVALVKSLDLLTQYAALYSPTSDIVHSDNILNHFQLENDELLYSESFDPSMLVFFRGEILKNIRRIRSIVSNNHRAEITQYSHEAQQAFISNHYN